MKLIIAGGRDFGDYNALSVAVKTIQADIPEDEDIAIVSGTARGADRLGEQFAELNDIRVVKYPANWDYYGKSAGFRRNEEMARNATHLLAFWDGTSRGTEHMINTAKRFELKTTVVSY